MYLARVRILYTTRGVMRFPWITSVRRAALSVVCAVVLLGAVVAVRANLRAGSKESTIGAGDEHSMFASTVADTRKIVLHVEGMQCTSCESTITAMLKRTPGVVGAAVSVERAQAIVVYDPAKTSPAKLIDVIESLGYGAAVQRT